MNEGESLMPDTPLTPEEKILSRARRSTSGQTLQLVAWVEGLLRERVQQQERIKQLEKALDEWARGDQERARTLFPRTETR